MNIRMPEILTISSAILLVGGQTIPGWVFFGLAMLTAIGRLGLQQQEKQDQAQKIDTTAKAINDAGEAVGRFMSSLASRDEYKNNTKLN